MVARVLIALLILASPAFAQPAPEPTFTLTLTAKDIEILGSALGELPAKIANPLINKLQAQINEQTKKPPKEDPPK